MLTLQYISQYEYNNLAIGEKVRKIISAVREGKILLIEGKLEATEESELIKTTMELIDRKFKGIEICTIEAQQRNETVGDSIKKSIATMLLGKREGLTIVGPASIVKEIRKNPGKIELLTKEQKNGKRGSNKR